MDTLWLLQCVQLLLEEVQSNIKVAGMEAIADLKELESISYS